MIARDTSNVKAMCSLLTITALLPDPKRAGYACLRYQPSRNAELVDLYFKVVENPSVWMEATHVLIELVRYLKFAAMKQQDENKESKKSMKSSSASASGSRSRSGSGSGSASKSGSSSTSRSGTKAGSHNHVRNAKATHAMPPITYYHDIDDRPEESPSPNHYRRNNHFNNSSSSSNINYGSGGLDLNDSHSSNNHNYIDDEPEYNNYETERLPFNNRGSSSSPSHRSGAGGIGHPRPNSKAAAVNEALIQRGFTSYYGGTSSSGGPTVVTGTLVDR